MNRPLPIVLFLLMAIACTTAARNWSITSPERSKTISVTLSPGVAAYKQDAVPTGAVRFTATIRNVTDQMIRIAHPSLCLPTDNPSGSFRPPKALHGNSEILLKIVRPDAATLILRDGPFFFDPGQVDSFMIAPRGTAHFDLGWFFPNARGRWEDSALADSAFMHKGKYRVQLLVRNFCPKAALYDPASERTMMVDVWTGEALSNEVDVVIE